MWTFQLGDVHSICVQFDVASPLSIYMYLGRLVMYTTFFFALYIYILHKTQGSGHSVEGLIVGGKFEKDIWYAQREAQCGPNLKGEREICVHIYMERSPTIRYSKTGLPAPRFFPTWISGKSIHKTSPNFERTAF